MKPIHFRSISSHILSTWHKCPPEQEDIYQIYDLGVCISKLKVTSQGEKKILWENLEALFPHPPHSFSYYPSVAQVSTF